MNAMKTTALLLLLVATIATSSYGSDNDVDGIVPEVSCLYFRGHLCNLTSIMLAGQEYFSGEGPSALKLQRDNADQSEADSSAKVPACTLSCNPLFSDLNLHAKMLT